jgi:hypothetical protein
METNTKSDEYYLAQRVKNLSTDDLVEMLKFAQFLGDRKAIRSGKSKRGHSKNVEIMKDADPRNDDQD